jgi:hypothetical protein
MKKILLLAVLAIFMSAPLMAKKKITYKNVFPKEFKKIYKPGMTLDAFQKKNPDLEGDNSFEFRTTFDIINPTEDIKELTLYFDMDNNRPLYELIINYHTAAARDQAVEKMYGPPNNGKDWLWTMPDGVTTKAWIFMNKLVIAIAYPNTEWAKDWK